MKSANQLLRTARDLLQFPEDWTKGDLQNKETGALCIYGALYMADIGVASPHDGSRYPGAAVYEAVRTIGRIAWTVRPMPGALDYVGGFNNHPDTTHQDILNVLDEAIATTLPSHELSCLSYVFE